MKGAAALGVSPALARAARRERSILRWRRCGQRGGGGGTSVGHLPAYLPDPKQVKCSCLKRQRARAREETGCCRVPAPAQQRRPAPLICCRLAGSAQRSAAQHPCAPHSAHLVPGARIVTLKLQARAAAAFGGAAGVGGEGKSGCYGDRAPEGPLLRVQPAVTCMEAIGRRGREQGEGNVGWERSGTRRMQLQ